jgi:hypothetical protein
LLFLLLLIGPREHYQPSLNDQSLPMTSSVDHVLLPHQSWLLLISSHEHDQPSSNDQSLPMISFVDFVFVLLFRITLIIFITCYNITNNVLENSTYEFQCIY